MVRKIVSYLFLLVWIILIIFKTPKRSINSYIFQRMPVLQYVSPLKNLS